MYRVYFDHQFVAWTKHAGTKPHIRNGPWVEIAAHLNQVIDIHRNRSKTLVSSLVQLRDITDELPDAWVVIHAHSKIETFNRAAEELLGLTPSDHGRYLITLIRDPSLSKLVHSDNLSDPTEIVSPVNDQQRLELRCFNVSNNRKIVVARDVTQLNRLLTMRQDFIANVSHELRTPLTTIIGYLETISSSEVDDGTIRDLVQRLNSPAHRMQNLVDDLLTLTRLESAPMPQQDVLDMVHASEHIQTIVAEMRHISRGVHAITMELDENLIVEAVPSEIHSAFSNLISNAIRYSPNEEKVVIRWFRTKNGARFEVQDHGIGIAPEHLTRITERFYRIDLKSARVRGGTGLGLAIVKHILRRHHSQLCVESKLGVGSLFYFCLPLKFEFKE